MSTIAEIVNTFDLAPGTKRDLITALMMREELIAIELRLAALQFGLFPQVVQEMFYRSGLGDPPSEQERAYVGQQFDNLMDQWRREWNEQHGQDN